MKKKNSYKKLYLTILRIGQDRVHDGVSFNELKELLIQKGYDFDNDCIELAVRQWFYDSFHHRGTDGRPYTGIQHLDNHLDCSFILKGESCLKLLSYETSRNSWRNGIIALSLSLLAISYTIYHNYEKDKKDGMNATTTTNHLPATH